jgi:hypothetical protein
MSANLVQIDGKFYTPEIALQIKHAQSQEEHFALLQLTKKIQLNSLYGALLSKGFRWALEEMIGASVTYTGRHITTHMMNTVAMLLTGVKAQLRKFFDLTTGKDKKVMNIYVADNKAIIYSDTDSAYFKTSAEGDTREERIDDAVLIADAVAEELNNSFDDFMRDAFLCQPGYDNIIRAGREIVAERALFQARKKYIAKVVDLDGFRLDKPKLKAQGSEIKKSDTPKTIQNFLKKTLDKILDGLNYDELSQFINQQRKELFREKIAPSEIILLGTSKGCNNLEHYTEVYFAEISGKPMKKSNGKKITVPGQVRAACNYNVLLEEFEDNISPKINNGDKVKVFQLKSNSYGFTTIALPAELSHFPHWFSEYFEIDLKLSEEKLITAKLEGIFECMGLEVPTPQLTHVKSFVKF